MSKVVTYKTSSPSGDTISFLAGIRQIWLDTGKKGVLYHRLGMVGGSYEGADSAYENEEKQPICFNQYTFEMIKPLILSQEYIEDYIIFEGQEHEVDLDKLRQESFTNQPKGSLNRYPNYVFPEMATDLSCIWINVSKEVEYSGKVVINFTSRHRNTFINYYFLKLHEDHLIFTGLKKEYDLFCGEWKLNIPLLVVNDFHHLAIVINSCKFFMGNASMCFQIAEAVKVPRILETFPFMPNVIPVGMLAYDAYHQGAIQYYFTKLLNK